MITPLAIKQIDSRANYIPHFVSPSNPEKLARLQTQFLESKKKATTTIASSMAAVLAIHMLLGINQLVALGLIALTTIYCWRKYCSLCKCPNCELNLITRKDKLRMPAAGFSSKRCPRCQIQLTKITHGIKMTDAQARNAEIKRLGCRF